MVGVAVAQKIDQLRKDEIAHRDKNLAIEIRNQIAELFK